MAIRRTADLLTELFGRRGRKYLGCALLLGSVFFANTLTAQTPQRPRILGISHIGLLAHDFEASRAFYGHFLGFAEPYDLKKPDGSLSMTFFKINDNQVIELFPESTPNTDRMTHYSLITDDIEAMRAYLASKGFKVPSQANRARIGNLSFNVKDPDGETVEMVQYMPDGKTLLNKGKFLNPNAISDHMTHVGLIVPPPMDVEYKFYTDVLGFKEFWQGSADGKTLSYVNLRVPDGTDYDEFILTKDVPPPTARGVAHHLCLQVPSVPAAVAKLEAEPYYKEVYKREIEIHVGKNHKRQANLFDPDGTRVELMEPDTVDGTPAPSSTAPPPQ
ncbi:MAG TPA: VOC family protein [Terracidiphilus sp.]|jgi:catechol 2,3-dioxygenase-like lactoylglutathione lyase family enzyme